ncbi:hypothetical protein JTB14_001127 [Gonioctena quinquepunctata]|nr:hypothetical protein JTB14_001127 [Gonioctena quinquepunctata]
MPMQITTTAQVPFEKCFLNVVGPLPVTERGNGYISTFQCDLSKFSCAITIPNQEANTIARAFDENIVCIIGTPQIIVTDQGANLMSSVFKETCKLLRIDKINTCTFRPQSNGALERSHLTLGEYLRNFVEGSQDNWDTWIPYTMFSYKTSHNMSTDFTPFELLFGHKATLPSSLKKTPEVLYNYEDYNYELKSRMHQIARENLR